METKVAPNLLSLPVELQEMIEAHLSKHDLTVCIRVCKTWHDRLIGSIWDSISLSDWNTFHSLKSLYGSPEVMPDDTNATPDASQTSRVVPATPFKRQIHRIRVLTLSVTSLQELFYEQPSVTDDVGHDKNELDNDRALSVGLPDLGLEELVVLFNDDPGQNHGGGPYGFGKARINGADPPPNAHINVQPILQILGRSKNLRLLFINLGPLSKRGQIKDQARLLAALPKSLEELSIHSYCFSMWTKWAHSNKVTPQEKEADFVNRLPEFFSGLKPFGALKTLHMYLFEHSTLPLTSVIMALLEYCPALEELSALTLSDDARLAKILSECSRGWKTVAIYPGPLSAAVILEHSSTLENLRMPGGTNFPNAYIQKFLCSASNLKRLDLIPSDNWGYGQAIKLLASDIVESSENWACLKLQSFKCIIDGIPRPDLRFRSNGRPLNEILHDPSHYTTEQSQEIQKKILIQLGQLCMLQEITLGLNNLDLDIGNHGLYWHEQDTEGDYYNQYEVQQGRQYACLSLSMESGLDQLKDLKQLKRLRLEGMSVCMGAREQAWIKENWLHFGKESRDSFWSSRGHGMHGNEAHAEVMYDEFDWW